MAAVRTPVVLAVGAAVVIAAGVGAVLLMQKHTPVAAPQHVTTEPATTGASPPADCLLPGPPPVAPSGVTATAADMQLGRDVSQHFVNQLEAYQACRDAQADHAPPGVSQKQKDTWVAQGDDAVDEAHAVADAFATQLKIYKDRTGAK
jgi:hypothetical protein